MTKEQALEILRQPDRIGCNLIKANDEESCKFNQESIEALNMAIKALEQQPSEGCVSRAEVDHLCFEYLKPNTDDNIAFYEHFCDMPPVTPTRKAGKWIKSGGSFRCSECMSMPEFKDIRTLKYCPNCGAKMRGSENG